jgi:putative acetyltransferase
MAIRVVPDDLSGPDIRALLQIHFAGMLATSPAESCHFLDFDGLRAADVTFWSAWDGDALAGCGAVKELDPTHGEVKSMRTDAAHLRKGVASALLNKIIQTSRGRGYQRLSLETGSGEAFDASHALYRRFGFRPCAPFASYGEDPFSRFFTLAL